jgi:hypothetical protein
VWTKVGVDDSERIDILNKNIGYPFGTSGILTFSKYPIAKQDAYRFKCAPYTDGVVFKGVVYTKIDVSAKKIGLKFAHVFNTHPTAYIVTSEDAKSTFEQFRSYIYYRYRDRYFRNETLLAFDKQFNEAIVADYKKVDNIHKRQINEIKTFMTVTLGKYRKAEDFVESGVFLAGDMNINKYNTWERELSDEKYMHRDLGVSEDMTNARLRAWNEQEYTNFVLKNLPKWITDKEPFKKSLETGLESLFSTNDHEWARLSKVVSFVNELIDETDDDRIDVIAKAKKIFMKALHGIRNGEESVRFSESKVKVGTQYCTFIGQTELKTPHLIVNPCYWNIMDHIHSRNLSKPNEFIGRALFEYSSIAGNKDRREPWMSVVDKLHRTLPSSLAYIKQLSDAADEEDDYKKGDETWGGMAGSSKEADDGSNFKLFYPIKDPVSFPDYPTIAKFMNKKPSKAFEKTMPVHLVREQFKLGSDADGTGYKEFPFGYFTWDGARWGNDMQTLKLRGNSMTLGEHWPNFLYEMIDHVVYDESEDGGNVPPKHAFVSALRPIMKYPVKVVSMVLSDETCLPYGRSADDAPVWCDLSDHYPIVAQFFYDDIIPALTELENGMLNDIVPPKTTLTHTVLPARLSLADLDEITSRKIRLDVSNEFCDGKILTDPPPELAGGYTREEEWIQKEERTRKNEKYKLVKATGFQGSRIHP